MSYEVGQKVRVVANTCNHDFEIGEIVTVKRLDLSGEVSSCYNDVDWWLIDNEDIEPIEGGNE